MQRRISFTVLPIYFTALVVLLTWTSLAQGAAINLDSSPSRRDLAEGAGTFGIDVLYDDVMKRDAEIDGPDGVVKDWHTLALGARDTGDDDEMMDGDVDLSKRWYTLVEIAEAPESE